MIIENMSREEMIKFIKKHCVKVITDIPGTNFKKEQWYEVFLDEGGAGMWDDDGNFVDFYDFPVDKHLEQKGR